MAGLLADLRNARSYVAGVAGTDVMSGTDLSTGTTARLMTIAAPTATAQTYTFSGAGGNLTLAGADGSSQTISVADIGLGPRRRINFDQLGIKLTFNGGTSGKAGGGPRFGPDHGRPQHHQVTGLFTPSQTTSNFYAGLVGKIGTASAQAAEMATNQQRVVDQLTTRVRRSAASPSTRKRPT